MNHQPRYFFFDDLQKIKEHYGELSEAERRELKSHIALNSPDPEAVALFADVCGDDWAHIYPPAEKSEPVTTVSAIDTFLETYGHTSPEEDALLERLIFNPTPDYAGVLEAEVLAGDPPVSEPQDLTTERINSFMAAHPDSVLPVAKEPVAQAPDAASQSPAAVMSAQVSQSNESGTRQPDAQREDAPAQKTPRAQDAAVQRQTVAPAAENTSLSESLAKIYIKQGRYQRAFEIISDLNLKYPEKSVYFADQLRFLKKLMAIQAAVKE